MDNLKQLLKETQQIGSWSNPHLNINKKIEILIENSKMWDDAYILEEYGVTREDLAQEIKKEVIKETLKNG